MAKKKSLQKVADFEKLKTRKQVKTYLSKSAEHFNELLEYLQERLNDSYIKKLGEENKITELIVECFDFQNDEESTRWTRNTTYEINHSLIARTVHNYLIEYRTFPSMPIISEETGLSRTTIYRHLKDGLKTEYNSLVKGKLEYMTTHALEKLYLIGIQNSDPRALKAFIELNGALAKQGYNTSINNYIQINNLKISKEEFDQLPKEAISQIEKLVFDNLRTNSSIV